MKIALKLFPVILVMLIFSGCTTVDDFRKMSPNERARRVCEKRKNIISLAGEKATFASAIQQSQADLARGYKLHRQCQQVKVYGAAMTSCSGQGNNISCSEYRPESLQTRCIESPVAINADLERQNIQSWSAALSSREEQLRNEWQSCMSHIGNLSAEDAYRYYR